jgi:hypothetical protein
VSCDRCAKDVAEGERVLVLLTDGSTVWRHGACHEGTAGA